MILLFHFNLYHLAKQLSSVELYITVALVKYFTKGKKTLEVKTYLRQLTNIFCSCFAWSGC